MVVKETPSPFFFVQEKNILSLFLFAVQARFHERSTGLLLAIYSELKALLDLTTA
jgi:hypothetical protein